MPAGLEERNDGKAFSDPERADFQRDRIVRAAERLVAVSGYERVRLKDVAEAAGVSVGTVQHYFGAREHLMSETFRRNALARVRAWADAAEGHDDPWDRIVALIDHAMKPEAFRERSVVWLEFSAAAAREPELRERMSLVYEEWRRPVREAVDEGIASGRFQSSVPADMIVDLILTGIDGCEVANAIEASDMEYERMRLMLLHGARSLLGAGA